MRKILFTIALGLITLAGYSQGIEDAVRYSNFEHNGDARFMAMGGAFGALGANISSFNYNPAGIGMFRKSDASITMSFIKQKNTTTYNGEMSKESFDDFSINHAGIVISGDQMNIPTGGGWKNFQVGISYSLLKNFENETYFGGTNTTNSLGDFYAGMAEGYNYFDIANDYQGYFSYDLHPAWNSYMFDTIGGYIDSYYSLSPVTGGVSQAKLIESWGSLNEISIAFGGNYEDKLYVGASIGIPILDYHQIITREEAALDPNNPLNADSYFHAIVKDYLDTKAHGVNLKLGMIYQANSMLRLGAAFHTPTYYFDMNDEWTTDMYTDLTGEYFEAPLGYYEYRMSTPLKAIGSVALIFNKFGLISIDYEYVDYSTAKFDSDDYDFDTENESISNYLQSTSNIRIGTEWKLMNFSVRAGYAFYGSPYDNEDLDGEKRMFSLGAGYREGNYYFDVAWVQTKTDNIDYMYFLDDGYSFVASPKASINNTVSRLQFTFGVRF